MNRALLAIALIGVTGSSVAPVDRLTDRDVKALVARIEEGRDRFDDELDEKMKRSIIRDGTTEAKVADFLNDFQEAIDRLEERLKPDYAGSAEVAALLRLGSRIEAAFRRQAPGMKGQSEWNRLASDLKVLAASYGASFPLQDNAAVRRVGDGELAEAADGIARGANQVKKSLDNELKKNPAISKESRQGMVAEADSLSKDAKTLRSRVKDGQPSSAEAERLLARAGKLQEIILPRKLPATSAAWNGLRSGLETVALAYGVRPTTPSASAFAAH